MVTSKNCVCVCVGVCVWVCVGRYTWITVRGLSDGYQSGKPNRVTHAERIRYVSEHLVLITLAPTQRHTM